MITEEQLARAAFGAIPAQEDAAVFIDDAALRAFKKIVVDGPGQIPPKERLAIFASALAARMAGMDAEDFAPQSQAGEYLMHFLSAAGFFGAEGCEIGEDDTAPPAWV